MNYKLLTVISFITILLFSCRSSEKALPIVGTWEWSTGSRIILPTGFERLHKDKDPKYLIIEGGTEIFEFKQDGTYKVSYTSPQTPYREEQGNWTLVGDNLNLEFLETDFGPNGIISQYKIPFNDDANLDLQWSVQYREFSDAKYEELRNNGIFESDSYTISAKDSLLNSDGTLINSLITIHYNKL